MFLHNRNKKFIFLRIFKIREKAVAVLMTVLNFNFFLFENLFLRKKLRDPRLKGRPGNVVVGHLHRYSVHAGAGGLVVDVVRPVFIVHDVQRGAGPRRALDVHLQAADRRLDAAAVHHKGVHDEGLAQLKATAVDGDL